MDEDKQAPESLQTEVAPIRMRDFEFRTIIEAHSKLEARSIGRARVRAFLQQFAIRFAFSFQGDDDVCLCEAHRRDKLYDVQTGQELALTWSEVPLPVGINFHSFHHSKVLDGTSSTARAGSRPAPSTLANQQILRARRGLFIARDPQRTAAERLALSWSAVEQLVKGGEEGKGAAIVPFAKVATLVHIRKQMARIHRDAMTALWARILLDHANADVMKQFDIWIPNMAVSLSKWKLIPSTMLKNMWASGTLPTLDDVSDENAISKLSENWDALPALRDAIEPIAPLAANELYRFLEWFAKDVKKAPKEIGNGAGLVKHALQSYEDIESFLFFVYELRNRFVHDGEGFEDAQQITIIQILERFVALVEPVLLVVSSQAEHARSIEQTFELARDLFDDLATLGKNSNDTPIAQRKLTPERIHELLFTL